MRKKILYAAIVIHINQCNIDKQDLEEKNGEVDNKCQIQVAWLLQLVSIQ